MVTTSCALYPFCTRDCGCIERPAFPTPSDFQMAKELWQNSRTCGEIAKVCLRSWVVNLIVIASGAKQSIFNVAMPSHGLLRSARNDGDGAKQSHRVRGTIRKCEPVESPPSPARRMLATSPRKRGEVKNDREC